MAPRTPAAKVLEAELASTVRDIYHSDARDELSVNLVRQRVETKLGLGKDFFKDGNWKAKSKQLIKDTVVRAPDGVYPSPRRPSLRRGLTRTCDPRIS